jgi:hypothetical protein
MGIVGKPGQAWDVYAGREGLGSDHIELEVDAGKSLCFLDRRSIDFLASVDLFYKLAHVSP